MKIHVMKDAAKHANLDPATAVEWTQICHGPMPFMAISHDDYRHVGRWGYEPRKRKFSVTQYSKSRMGMRSHVIGYYLTFDKAMAAAKAWDAIRTEPPRDSISAHYTHLAKHGT